MTGGSDDLPDLDAVLAALGDPQRRRLYRQIADEPGIVCSALLPEAPRSTVSVYLKRLREAGLIRDERRGQLIANFVRGDGAWARFPDLLTALLAADRAG